MSEMANRFGPGGGMEFGQLLSAVLGERRDEARAPSGLEQRLKARLAQEAERIEPRAFAFAERVATRRSASSMWSAVTAHVVILLAVFVLASQHRAFRAAPRSAVVSLLAPPPVPPSVTVIGGGGGAHDLAPVAAGRLPKFAPEQIIAPKAPPTIPPKLAMEPTVVMQKDLKMASNDMPNLGMPNAPSASIGSLGTGTGGGIGSGNGKGVGPGNGGSFGGGVYHIGGGVRAPVVIAQVDPEFSEEARKQKFSGNVLVDLIVDEQGNPTHVRVARGVGLGLDEKAVEAVRQYRFKPAMKDGKPVRVELSVEVNFQIF